MRRTSLWKRFLGIGLAVGISFSTFAVPVMAEEISILDDVAEEEITDEETTEDWAEDINYNVLRSNNLNFGSMKIQKISSTEVAIDGLTQCHKKCAKVYLYIYLERKVNGSYGTYKSWKYETTNATNLSKGLRVAVPSGTYYRVRGYHAASNGGLKESTSTLTQGIKVK